MKAIILAAGKGSRLGSITLETPKSMLKLNDEHTLLSFNIQQLCNLNVDSIILITGYQSQKMESYALTLSEKYNITIEVAYNPFWNHCNVLGSLYIGLDKINDDFLFLHADTLTEIEVLNGIRESNCDICLAVDFKKCGEEEMKFWIDNNQIIRITKDQIGKEADGEFVGVAKFSKSMIEYFMKNSKAVFQKGELNHYMEKVIDNGLLDKSLLVGYFDASNYKTIEVDFEDDLKLARKLFS
jgi:choline kinase